jgi:flavorubredoxin
MAPSTPNPAPLLVAPDTFVIQDHQPVGAQGVLHRNSMLIRGRQPTVVDTGSPANRAEFLRQLFELVEPDDVRWVFLSHDDADHAGNARAVLDACRSAVAVTTWIGLQRLRAFGVELAAQRCRLLGTGGVLDIGDRALALERPPLFDAPGTRGLVDTSTNVYWAADAFAAYVPSPSEYADDVDGSAWQAGFVRFHQWSSPWFATVDPGWWDREIDRVAAREHRVVASAHGPVVRGEQVRRAIDILRELPAMPLEEPPARVVDDDR